MWTVFTNLGDAAITLPVAAICAGWLALFDVRLTCRWLAALTAGIALVGATKIIYAGWGLSIPASDFRVVSGHTMLSTSVWTVTLTLQLKWWRQPPIVGVLAGMAVGLLTGISRVVGHSHSLPEVICGWVLGVFVAAIFLRAAAGIQFDRLQPIWSTISLLLVATLAYGHKAPLQHLIETRSPELRSHVPSVIARLRQIQYRVFSHEATSAK